MKRILLPLLATGLLVVASCSDATKSTSTEGDTATSGMNAGADTASTTMAGGSATPGNQSQNADGTTNGMAMGDPNGPTGPHKDDKEFMMTAAHSDQNEIQQSKMALAKGVTGPAKEMADKMIADHTKSTADLKAIAAKKGVTLPTDMDAEHKALVPVMEKLSGKAFEQKYMAQMALDHQKTANTMRAHEKMTQDADLKSFIAKTVPVVEQHLNMAKMDPNMKM